MAIRLYSFFDGDRSNRVRWCLHEIGLAFTDYQDWQPGERLGVTLYTDWRWAEADALEEGALRGSLCCQLYLQYHRANAE